MQGSPLLILQQSVAILLVLALLAATLALLRRKGIAQFRVALPRTAGRMREITLVDRVALGPQHSLHLVQVREKVFLIGVSPAGCSRIAGFVEPICQAPLQKAPTC